MALVSIEEWMAQPEYDRIYMADTNFLFKSVHLVNADRDQYAVDDHKLLRDFRTKLLSCGCTILFNATTRHELLRLLRKLMIRAVLSEGHIDEREFNTNFIAVQTDTPNLHLQMDTYCKNVLKEGYITFFNELLGQDGEWLRQEYERVVAGCNYMAFGGKLKWEDAEKTMAQYGLDSSDAMIVNAAVQTADCCGLLTADADFRYCYKVKNFDVIMPNRLVRRRPPVSLDPFVAI